MKQLHALRAAFSMVELVFVIVILGIVSSIGSEVIAKVYEGYIVQRGQYRASIKTELALNQIANRLRYAIPGTVGFRLDKGSTFKFITETNTGDDKVLQWVAYDGDSFESKDSTSGKPGWSGFCDLEASSSTTINTPGSDLGLASSIIGNLGGSIANARIYLRAGTSYGVSSGSAETITLDTALSDEFLSERYKLAWSSYALEVDDIGDLYLHYNFAPILGQAIAGSSSLLLKNVTNFRFKGSEGSLRIKLCKDEQIGDDNNITSCKERVVF